MKLQDILVQGTLIFCAVWAINYFFSPKKSNDTQEIRSGQSFTAMPNAQMCKPMNTEIDFFDNEKVDVEKLETIQGHSSFYELSSFGASLDRLTFKRDLGGQEGDLTTIFPQNSVSREKRAFLVALNEQTPYYFRLVDKVIENGITKVVFEASTEQARMIKTYRFNETTYEMGLDLTLEPLKSDYPIQPRIFFPGPTLVDNVARNKDSGVVFTAKNSLKKITPAQSENTIWAAPQIFGVEDRYYINALVRDNDNFTQRAYYQADAQDHMTVILEGPSITEKTTWKLGFYCGPKEAASLAAVDQRLESVMGYGWLGPLAKLMMKLLNWIYTYTHNYGWAIIILTLLMRLIMFPFTRGEGDMRRKQHEMSRKRAYLQKKYKDDPEKLAQEQMKLIQEHGVFPGGGGCLPMLLQLPLFIGLNYALRSSIELYQAPFLWISDLSASDPYYILPTLVGISMFAVLSSTAKDPRHKFMMAFMAVVLGGIMASLSAGLTLYISVSTLLGFLQTQIVKATKA